MQHHRGEMEPSAQLGFSLQPLLEQLSQNEPSQFKSLLRPLSLQDELQHIPETEVEEADGKQLAEILTNHCPSHWVEMVTIQVFDKMNQTDLSEKAKDELRDFGIQELVLIRQDTVLSTKDAKKDKPSSLLPCRTPPCSYIPSLDSVVFSTSSETRKLIHESFLMPSRQRITRTPEPKCANLEETQQCAEEKEPALTHVQEEDVRNPEEAKEVFKGEKPGKQDKYRSIFEEEVQQLWKKNFWPGASENIHTVTQRYETLIPFCNPKILAGPFPHTTTLAKKCMLDWTQDNLAQTCPRAFYLSCKVLSRKGTCSFAELLAASAPDLQDALPQVLAQAQKLLLVVDAFEELRVPSGVGALVQGLCGDWRSQRPAPVLLGSLLTRKLLPTATLLVTTRPEALRELRFLVERPLLVELEGLSERDRRAYCLRHFGGEAQALRAFHLMKSNAALFRMGAAPAVCWMVCTCLRLRMDEGEDPRPTCQTATSLLLCFLCSRFAPARGGCPGPHLGAALRALCLLAAEGTWAQTSVFDGHDLRRLGMDESDLRPFLDRSILQKGRDCEGCYCFVHLSVQQFLAAALYVLGSEDHQDAGSPGWNIGGVQRLLCKEEGLQNPQLAPVGRFLFGLANEKRARELGTTFGCPVSTEVKQELLECRIRSAENRPFSSVTDTKEILYCLYESQEELLVKEAMAQVTEVSLHLQDTSDMVHAHSASSTVKTCRKCGCG
ncbi:hypothetical protein GH733_017279 [Mirounga leonina]|nr:hypothetical protein GH733_017279 [Mirounga leonina]